MKTRLLWLIGKRQGVRAAVWAVCGLWVIAVLLAATIAGPESLLPFGWIGWVGVARDQSAIRVGGFSLLCLNPLGRGI